MYDYSEEFKKFTKSISCVRTIIVENHRYHYPALEMLLGFHYWLHNQIDPIYRKQKKEWYSTPRLIHVLFMNNFSAAYSIFQAFETNSLMVTGPPLRSMLETVVKMEYLVSYPDERDNMIYADAVRSTKNKKKEKVIADVHKYISEDECNEQVILKQINGRYHFKWYLKKLYGDPNQDAGFYKHFSQLTHSSMDKMHQQLAWMHSHKSSNLLCSDVSNYDYEILDIIPQHLEALLFRNIVAELNGNKNMAAEGKFPYIELISFLDELYDVLPDNMESRESIKRMICCIKSQYLFTYR